MAGKQKVCERGKIRLSEYFKELKKGAYNSTTYKEKHM